MSASESGIDWDDLLEYCLGIETAAGPQPEAVGVQTARRGIAKLLGHATVLEIMERALSDAPGSELARRMLWLLRPDAAVEEIGQRLSRGSDDRFRLIDLLAGIPSDQSASLLLRIASAPDPGVDRWKLEWAMVQVLSDADVDIKDEVRIVELLLASGDARVRQAAKEFDGPE